MTAMTCCLAVRTNEFLDGGDGPDIIAGGLGNDRILGGPANDILSGNEGVTPDRFEFVTNSKRLCAERCVSVRGDVARAARRWNRQRTELPRRRLDRLVHPQSSRILFEFGGESIAMIRPEMIRAIDTGHR